MAEWDLAPDHWPRVDVSHKKVSDDTCIELTMSIAEEPELPEVKALIEPMLVPRLVSVGIPNQPELKRQIPYTKEDLCWVVSFNGQRLYELFHPGDPDALLKRRRTLIGAIREAETHLTNVLAQKWQEHLTRQFAREALSDFDYQSFKETEGKQPNPDS